eukprot:6175302-Pleurochrysis_carterae.AAC.1
MEFLALTHAPTFNTVSVDPRDERCMKCGFRQEVRQRIWDSLFMVQRVSCMFCYAINEQL